MLNSPLCPGARGGVGVGGLGFIWLMDKERKAIQPARRLFHSLTEEPSRVCFRAVFRVFTTTRDGPPFGDSQSFSHESAEQEISVNISTLKGSQRKKSSLISRRNVKGNILDRIKAFYGWIKASILWTKYCQSLLRWQTCLFFKNVFISFGRIKIINLRFLFFPQDRAFPFTCIH